MFWRVPEAAAADAALNSGRAAGAWARIASTGAGVTGADTAIEAACGLFSVVSKLGPLRFGSSARFASRRKPRKSNPPFAGAAFGAAACATAAGIPAEGALPSS